MQRIIGIDPGLVATGYAIIESDGRASHLIASNVIAGSGASVPARLGAIFDGLVRVIREHRPREAAVESVFVHKDASAALKLGQARGVAVCAAVVNQVPVYEYDTRVIKKTIVGKGNAGKEQVKFMVAHLLQVAQCSRDDEADAMAIALCHAFSRSAHMRLAEATR